MVAAIKALNAKIRSNKYLDYFCSTRMYNSGPGALCFGELGGWWKGVKELLRRKGWNGLGDA
jgi:hypothetical protein